MVMWEVNVSLVRRIWTDSSFMTSVDIWGFKEHQNDPLSHSFRRTPLVHPQIHTPQKSSTPHPKKTATYQQQECTQWFIHSFKRTWNLGSISVPASLCICCTTEQRDLVGLSSLIFLLVFCVYFHSLFPSLPVIFLIIWRPRSWLIEI